MMPSNNTGAELRRMAARYPGRLAHLIGPGGWRRPVLPYALDNGAFGAFVAGTSFDADAFDRLVTRASMHDEQPLWVVVPDVVGDAQATIESWHHWAPILRRRGWPLAFAVQDGMTPADIYTVAPDVVFVGGSKAWKWRTVPMWCAAFPRVHVGRVNQHAALQYLDELGAESCDGTGWFRGCSTQLSGLDDYLAGRKCQWLWAAGAEVLRVAVTDGNNPSSKEDGHSSLPSSKEDAP